MLTLKEIGEKRAQLWQSMKELNELSKTENRAFTAEENANWDRMNTEIEELETQESDVKQAETRATFLAETEKKLSASRGRQAQPDPLNNANPAGVAKEKEPTTEELKRAEHRSLFTKHLRGEMTRNEFENSCERRALQADIPSSGGYLATPMEMANQLIKFIDDIVFIRQKATKYPLPTAMSLGIPTLENDPGDAAWTAEIATGNEDSTMSFGRRSLTPHPVAKRIKVSRTLLRVATINPEDLVNRRLAYKFGITEEKAFLTGTGTGQPLGVFTASADGIPTSRDISTENTTTLITADGLINAKFNLKAQYQNSPTTAWGFSRTAVRNIRKLKDGNGQYLWLPGLAGTPSTILDIPYFMSEYVPSTFTTGLYVGIIGDWSFYWIADALSMGIQRLDELYAETNQVGFIGRKETDGMPVLAEAFTRVALA